MEKIAIILLHFGSAHDTKACLASIAKIKTQYHLKVFLVDNGSHTFFANPLKKFPFSFECIQNQTNLGFAGGNNKGIARALKQKYTHVMLLNNDTLVRKDLVDKLMEGFTNNDVGIVGPQITYTNKKLVWFGGGKLYLPFCLTRHQDMGQKSNARNNPFVTDFITGCCMVIKKEVFEKIGLLSLDYFLYWEDVDFCFLAKKNKFLCLLVPKPLVVHKISSATGIQGTQMVSAKQAYFYGRNPFIFAKKNSISVFFCLIGQVLVMFPFYLFKFQNSKALFTYRKGIYDGIQFTV